MEDALVCKNRQECSEAFEDWDALRIGVLSLDKSIYQFPDVKA